MRIRPCRRRRLSEFRNRRSRISQATGKGSFGGEVSTQEMSDLRLSWILGRGGIEVNRCNHESTPGVRAADLINDAEYRRSRRCYRRT